MTIDQKIALASSVATGVTSLFVMLTLFEMGKQRKSSYQPDIFPASQFFHASNYIHSTNSPPTIWNEIIKLENSAQNLEYDYFLRLHNIGNGAAKNIVVKWNIDIDNIVEAINAFSADLECNLNIKKEKVGASDFIFVEENGTNYGINLSADLIKKIDYLQPASIDSNAMKVKLPFTIISLYTICFKLCIINTSTKGKPRSDLETLFPWLGVTVSYEDIGGNTHVKGFNVVLALNMYSESTFSGQIEFSQTTS